jgi:hypothetical protein
MRSTQIAAIRGTRAGIGRSSVIDDITADEVIVLVIKPNLRRMRAFLDSPSERNLPGRRGITWQGRWDRAVVAACVAGALLLGLITLAAYY